MQISQNALLLSTLLDLRIQSHLYFFYSLNPFHHLIAQKVMDFGKKERLITINPVALSLLDARLMKLIFLQDLYRKSFPKEKKKSLICCWLVILQLYYSSPLVSIQRFVRAINRTLFTKFQPVVKQEATEAYLIWYADLQFKRLEALTVTFNYENSKIHLLFK